jgi:hypothetical protein
MLSMHKAVDSIPKTKNKEEEKVKVVHLVWSCGRDSSDKTKEREI